jgi:hypothetical protein
MSNPDDAAADTRPAAGRLDDLDRRLAAAYGRLSGRGGAAAEREGDALRARHARLHEQVKGGPDSSSVLGEIEALSAAIDDWVSRLDRDQHRAEAKDR